MGVDIWTVKIKSESKNKSYIDWDDCIEDDGWENIIPESNSIHSRGYGKVHHSFINMLLSTRDYTYDYEDEKNPIKLFEGHPCCEEITLRVVCDRLKYFIDCIELNNISDYVWIDVEYSLNRINYTQIKDLYEYLHLALENGFLIWFSF